MLTKLRTRFWAIAGLVLAATVAVADVPPKITEAIAKAESAVQAIVKIPNDQRTFDNTLGAIDDLSVRLDNDTSLTIFMQYVSTDAKQRQDARDAEEAVSNYLIDLSKREDLYNAVKAYADTKPALSGEQKRFLEFTMRDYRRSGMMLDADKRKRLTEIEKELQKMSTDFQTNIYEDETVVMLTRAELKGVPVDTLHTMKMAVGGLYVVPMDGPTFSAILDYADNELTRQKVWTEYKRRGGKKNANLLEKILKLRWEGATLLGYKNTVDYEIETRMAKNSETVAKFYQDLKPVVRKKAQLDYNELLAAKKAQTGNKNAKLYPWDQSYYKNRLMMSKYAVDSQKVAEYFPVKAVFDGLFQITASLYGIEFKDVTANASSLGLPIWHPDVKLWAVTDKANGELLGHIYTDLHPRENKYNHAACWGLQSRKVWSDGTVQKPLAALVTNFTKPTADKPSLMTHDEVETFFHEFGHALHNVLTKANYGRFSGTAVARDFVEAPSQMFENWVWEPSVLKLFAKHYKTGQPLSPAMLQGMKNAQTLGSGLETEHQMYYGLTDQAYHTAPGGVVDTTKVGVDLLHEVELYPNPIGTMFQSSFGHLMGYQGAYYGYLWSLVYAQDMFERFQEKGILSPEAGAYYREKILSRGGTMDEMDMLRDYLGREPRTDAFLKHLGLKK
ncbi:MAG: M3 family metallopeptidase [Fimbriimonas sp.]